jgi:AraC-like DNA-binding protein
MTSIPATCVNPSDKSVVFNVGYRSGCNPFVTDLELISELMRKGTENPGPSLIFENDLIMYGIIVDNPEVAIYLGPVIIDDQDTSTISEYIKNHNLITNSPNMNLSSIVQLTSALSTIYMEITGKLISESEIVLDQNSQSSDLTDSAEFQTYIMNNSENDIHRLSYTYEKMIAKQIREGDVEGIAKLTDLKNGSMPINYNDELYGKVAEDQFKQWEYLTVAAITIFSRAAIEAGVDALSAYAISDIFLQRLEKSKSIIEAMNISHQAQIEYASQVRKLLDRQSRSTYVEKAKGFIANHLNKHFTLEEVAEAAGISRAYLAQRFVHEEEISVMDYTRNKRIDAAANMLRYSNENISTISNYLCFHSQSHFGAVFKKVTGLTPHKYREKFSLIDVQSPSSDLNL